MIYRVAAATVALGIVLSGCQSSDNADPQPGSRGESNPVASIEQVDQSENIEAIEDYEWIDSKIAELIKKEGRPKKLKDLIRSKGTPDADPFAEDPFAGSSDEAPECEVTSVDSPSEVEARFHVQVSSDVTYEIVKDSSGFCRVPDIESGSQVTVFPGIGQRLYYINGDAQEAGDAVDHFNYDLDEQVQQHELDVGDGELLVKSVSSSTVLEETNSCKACDFRLDGLPAGYNFENADLSDSDLSGSTMYNLALGEGSSLKGARIGVYAHKDDDDVEQIPAVVAETSFAGTDVSGLLIDGVILDETVSFKDALIPGDPMTVKSSTVSFPLVPVWENVVFDDASFMVGREGSNALRGDKDKAVEIDVTVINSRFVGSRPLFDYTQWNMSTLSHTDFSGASFEHANLCGVTARAAKFVGGSLTEADLSGAYLREADLSSALLGLANFNGAMLGAVGSSKSIINQNKSDCRADEPGDQAGASSFARVDARSANFSGVDANQVDFTGSYFYKGSFSQSELNSSRFDKALISEADFSQARLESASFQDVQCINCRFTDARLGSSDSANSGTNFRNSYLYGSILKEAEILDGADFRNSLCCSAKAGKWEFVAGLLSDPPTVGYEPTDMSGDKFKQVGNCPDGSGPGKTGCSGQETPADPPQIPASCTAAASYICSSNIATVAGTGTAGFSEDDAGGATKSKLNNPGGVVAYRYAEDADRPEATINRLVIADTDNHVVRAVNLGTQEITVVAGQPEQAGFAGDGGQAVDAELDSPTAVTVDGFGRIYIADSENNRIRRVEQDGTIQTIIGDGKAETVSQPMDVAVRCGTQQNDCEVFVADTGNHRVKYLTQTGRLKVFAGKGEPGKPTDGATATTAALNTPVAVSLDSFGNVLIADQKNNAIQLVDVDGKIWKGVPSGTDQELQSPTDIYTDLRDNLYTSMNAVEGEDEATADLNQITRLNSFFKNDPGPLVNKSGNPGFSGDGSDAMGAKLKDPRSVAVAPWGQVFIADTGNQRIRGIAKK